MTEDRPQIMFVGAREVRVIPKGWQHPRDLSGRYVPLLPYGYPNDDKPATPETTMPPTPWKGVTEIVAYETISEGTPISPAFPNTPEGRRDLVAYCVANCFPFGRQKAGAEAWAAILFGNAAITPDGTVIATEG